MNEKEVEFFELVAAAYNENPSKASEWEKGFMNDIIARHEKYGADTFISGKQWGIINRVAEKLGVPC